MSKTLALIYGWLAYVIFFLTFVYAFYGGRYRDYRRRVRMLIPIPKLSKAEAKAKTAGQA